MKIYESEKRNLLSQTTGIGLPESAAQSFVGQHRLRKTTDPHVGTFLRKLAGVRASRILISTRLYPADLQTEVGHERGGCKAVFMRGLIDHDALNLWRAFGVSGSRETLSPLFHTFDNHPLLIQALAGVVAHDRRTPGDFDSWHRNHTDFNPFQLSQIQARSHVLATALEGLDETAQKVLFTIAAFRMPTSYDTLVALFVGESKRFSNEDELVSTLEDLEDRGLLGWDRRANRYDLHPIVRGVVWSSLGKETRQNIYETLNIHFTSLTTEQENEVQNLDDLAATIELYNSLIGLERFDEAWKLFNERLVDPMIFKLGNVFEAREMLVALFPQGLSQMPSPSNSKDQNEVLFGLALCIVDQPRQAAELHRQAIEMIKVMPVDDESSDFYVMYSFMAEQLCFSGSLYEAEVAASQGVLAARKDGSESLSLAFLGLTLAARGRYEESEMAFKRAQVLGDETDLVGDSHAICTWWKGQYNDTYTLAQTTRTWYQKNPFQGRLIRTMWLQGKAALGLGKLPEAEQYLHDALVLARKLNQIVEELPARIGLAELRQRQGDLKAARELLEDVWEPAARGSFRLFHADACNVLAQIERDAGNHEAAIKAAMDAYRLAWCDGPPFAYYYGLQKARGHLSALGVPEPNLPPFDASRYEPMPKVEIDPPEDTTPG